MPRTVESASRVVRTGGHLAEEIDRQVVLLSIEAGNYYGLDEIGSEIWRELGNETPVSDLCARLAARYEAPGDVIEKDVFAFLDHLAKHGLISVK